jgi:hypothetical protein
VSGGWNIGRRPDQGTRDLKISRGDIGYQDITDVIPTGRIDEGGNRGPVDANSGVVGYVPSILQPNIDVVILSKLGLMMLPT